MNFVSFFGRLLARDLCGVGTTLISSNVNSAWHQRWFSRRLDAEC